jgi:hypothetical protein
MLRHPKEFKFTPGKINKTLCQKQNATQKGWWSSWSVSLPSVLEGLGSVPSITAFERKNKEWKLWHATTGMNLEDIMKSEISQSQKGKCCMISLI